MQRSRCVIVAHQSKPRHIAKQRFPKASLWWGLGRSPNLPCYFSKFPKSQADVLLAVLSTLSVEVSRRVTQPVAVLADR